MIEHGILIAGRVVADSARVLRDPASWWKLGVRGARARAEEVNVVLSHWTGGRSHTANAGPTVFRNMMARKSKKTGKPLTVGVHFLIAAAPQQDDWAPIWQLGDPGKIATVHVGARDIIARSVGIERVNPGLRGRVATADSRLFPRPAAPRLFEGRAVDALGFSRGETNSFVWLCEMLAGAREAHDAGIIIPRTVIAGADGELLDRRLTNAERRRAKGHLEHCHVVSPSTAPADQKLDVALISSTELLAEGWRPVAA